MMELLQMEEIQSFQGGRWAEPVSLQVHSGQCVAIQGTPSQCDALFEIITGLRRPGAGQLRILGKDPTQLTPQEKSGMYLYSIGAAPGGMGFLPELRLIDQLALPLQMAGFSRQKAVEKIRSSAKGLTPMHALYTPPSRSTQRTIAMAKVLRVSLMEPKLRVLCRSLEDLERVDSLAAWQGLLERMSRSAALVYLFCGTPPAEMQWTQLYGL